MSDGGHADYSSNPLDIVTEQFQYFELANMSKFLVPLVREIVTCLGLPPEEFYHTYDTHS